MRNRVIANRKRPVAEIELLVAGSEYVDVAVVSDIEIVVCLLIRFPNQVGFSMESHDLPGLLVEHQKLSIG